MKNWNDIFAGGVAMAVVGTVVVLGGAVILGLGVRVFRCIAF